MTVDLMLLSLVTAADCWFASPDQQSPLRHMLRNGGQCARRHPFLLVHRVEVFWPQTAVWPVVVFVMFEVPRVRHVVPTSHCLRFVAHQGSLATKTTVLVNLSEVALDGSLHKAPCRGEGTGKNPTDRANLGWKWSVAVDAHGIPISWAIAGLNRKDMKLLGPTLDDVAQSGALEEIETLHLDRGYDYPAIRAQLAGLGLNDLNIQRRSQPGETSSVPGPTARTALGRRGHQFVAEQLRSAPSQHRPPYPTPSRTALPRRGSAHHGEAHRLVQPLGPGFTDRVGVRSLVDQLSVVATSCPRRFLL